MSDRFRFALSNISGAQWQSFERLASVFLKSEYDNLRTLADPSGDEGRDSALFTPADDDQVAIQYSVTTDWQSKVRKTAKRITDKHPDVTVLVYATPHSVGNKVVSARRGVSKDFHMYLDVRDAEWFVENYAATPANREAAEQFARTIADPILASKNLIEDSPLLTSHESKAALMYLVLQREDDSQDRQLTKLCFDALIKAILRDTDNENRMKRSDIQARVVDLLGTHDEQQVHAYVDLALDRAKKRTVRHWEKEDGFCLTFDERNRIAEGIARIVGFKEEFDSELEDKLFFIAEGLGVDGGLIDTEAVLLRLRRVMERFLFERGEAFVESLRTGEQLAFVSDEIKDVAVQDLSKHPDTSSLRSQMVDLITATIERSFLLPSANSQHFLRSMGEAYTLFAFMRETPNVQSAVSKLFSQGDFWLDTSVVLPLLAEELLDEEERSYSRLISACRDAGVHLYITHGVAEEINAHLDMCMRAWRAGKSWNGRTPFLYAAYVWSGRPSGDFNNWIERFRGTARPIDDLLIYLAEVQRIRFASLKDDYASADETLRWHTQQFWTEVHESRRQKHGDGPDDIVINQLAMDDAENFLGVLQRRKKEQLEGPFGYSAWWLTLDRYAFKAAKDIGERNGSLFDSPVLSLDFLTFYLSVGPARRSLTRNIERGLPLALDTSLLDALPKDLLEAADKVRKSAEGQSERVIRRRIRDHLDRQKLGSGPVKQTGIEGIYNDIRMALQSARN